jgi:hypothetical protein
MEMSATHMDLDVHANLRIWNILLSLSRPYKCLVSACEFLGKRIKFEYSRQTFYDCSAGQLLNEASFFIRIKIEMQSTDIGDGSEYQPQHRYYFHFFWKILIASKTGANLDPAKILRGPVWRHHERTSKLIFTISRAQWEWSFWSSKSSSG